MTFYCNWYEALNNGFQTDEVYHDFPKAFISVTYPKFFLMPNAYEILFQLRWEIFYADVHYRNLLP